MANTVRKHDLLGWWSLLSIPKCRHLGVWTYLPSCGRYISMKSFKWPYWTWDCPQVLEICFSVIYNLGLCMCDNPVQWQYPIKANFCYKVCPIIFRKYDILVRLKTLVPKEMNIIWYGFSDLIYFVTNKSIKTHHTTCRCISNL